MKHTKGGCHEVRHPIRVSGCAFGYYGRFGASGKRTRDHANDPAHRGVGGGRVLPRDARRDPRRLRRRAAGAVDADIRPGRWWQWTMRLVVVQTAVLIGWWLWQVRTEPPFGTFGVWPRSSSSGRIGAGPGWAASTAEQSDELG